MVDISHFDFNFFNLIIKDVEMTEKDPPHPLSLSRKLKTLDGLSIVGGSCRRAGVGGRGSVDGVYRGGGEICMSEERRVCHRCSLWGVSVYAFMKCDFLFLRGDSNEGNYNMQFILMFSLLHAIGYFVWYCCGYFLGMLLVQCTSSLHAYPVFLFFRTTSVAATDGRWPMYDGSFCFLRRLSCPPLELAKTSTLHAACTACTGAVVALSPKNKCVAIVLDVQ